MNEKSHEIFEEKYDQYTHQIDHQTIDLKINIKSDKLFQDWKVENKVFPLDDIINNYVSFEKTTELAKFFEEIDLNFFLLRKNYINKKNIWIVNCRTFSFEENKFNKKSKLRNIDNSGWWLDKETLKVAINTNPSFMLRAKLSSSDDLVKELLFKGNQVIRIKYCKINSYLTEKGYEYLNSGIWKNNWKWIISVIVSILLPILIQIYF
ncbi:MAG: hypothetical protein ACRC8P_02355 [Spiroplasma sp.]